MLRALLMLQIPCCEGKNAKLRLYLRAPGRLAIPGTIRVGRPIANLRDRRSRTVVDK